MADITGPQRLCLINVNESDKVNTLDLTSIVIGHTQCCVWGHQSLVRAVGLGFTVTVRAGLTCVEDFLVFCYAEAKIKIASGMEDRMQGL